MAVEVVSPTTNAVAAATGVANVPQSLSLVLQQFLDEWHYRILSTTLAQRWESKRTLSSAVHLLRQHGVELSSDEETELLKLSDEEVVERLVQKVPSQSAEHFKVFFLQLQIVVETVSRLRKAVEDGQADAVEAAIEDAEGAGVLQYILRQTVVHMGQELTNLRAVHTGWLKDTEAKMARLLRAAEEASNSKQLLIDAETSLKNLGAVQRKKAEKTLTVVSNNADVQMLKMSFAGWWMTIKSDKSEAKLRDTYEAQLQEVRANLNAIKVNQLSNVHGVMGKKIGENDNQIKADFFSIWMQEFKEEKMNKCIQEMQKKNEHQTQLLLQKSAEIGMNVMHRMTGNTGSDLCKLCLTSWVEEVKEWKINKKIQQASLEAEKRMKGALVNQKGHAVHVVSHLNTAEDEHIIHELFCIWHLLSLESGKAHDIANQLGLLDEKMRSISRRTKEAGLFVMTRVVTNFDTMRLLRCFSAWTAATRMERLKKYYDGKIDSKRYQLQSVQNLFREFAGRLETGITKSPRDSFRGQDDGVRLPELASNSGPYTQPSTIASNNGRPPTAPLRRSESGSASQSNLRMDRPQTAGGTRSSQTRSTPPPAPSRDDAPERRRDSREGSSREPLESS